MSLPVVSMRSAHSIRFAPHNPQVRTQPKRVHALMKSIQKIGLIYPVVVDTNGVLIDGHRRYSACLALGWKQIPCFVRAESPDEIYAGVNATARKMGGNELLAVWLKNPQAVSERAAKSLAAMEGVLGRKLVQRICAKGLSSRVFGTAKQIGRVCDDLSDEFMVRVVEWLIDSAVIGQVMKAIESGIDVKTLVGAIRRNKPIRMKGVIAA